MYHLHISGCVMHDARLRLPSDKLLVENGIVCMASSGRECGEGAGAAETKHRLKQFGRQASKQICWKEGKETR